MSSTDRPSLPLPPHVYVHVPFCARRCSYCDFSIAVRSPVPASRFIDAIKAELVTRGIRRAPEPLKSLYFGGGTPSKLGGELADLVEFLLVGSDRSACEVTVEANPEDISGPVVRAWKAAGVNRLSLGVQSFDPSVLAWMHRAHSTDQIRDAVAILVGEGIERLSVDLIFALPESLRRDWSRDLDSALELGVGHLSLYGLTIEEHTPLGKWTARGSTKRAPDERFEAEFLEAHHRLAAAGFLHYEVSNYALPGQESVHNSAYWRAVPYLGLGPSAHGFDGAKRRWNTREYARWLAQVSGGADPIEGEEAIGPAEQAAERVYLGLRTSAGLAATDAEFRHATRWVEAGWAQCVQDRLVLTPEGWLRLDALAVDMSAAVDPLGALDR